MKQLFLISSCVILCFLMSCKDSTTTNNNSVQETNKANSMKVHKAIETGDVSGLDSIIDKDFVDHSGPNGDVKGLDSLKAFFTMLHSHVPDIKITAIANATDGDYNFDYNRMTGTTNSEFMGMPANYKFDMTGVDVVKVRDGKAVEHWSYADPNEMMKMMGEMKKDSTMMKSGNMMNNRDSSKMHD
jgi:predicted SnoaL-like aldol condensation-catalyzing enzyme